MRACRGRARLAACLAAAALVLPALMAAGPAGDAPAGDAHALASKPPRGLAPDHGRTATQLNEYSNYVHLQPGWKSYPKNLIVDVSISWQRQAEPGDRHEPALSNHGAKQRQNTLQYINQRPVVVVQYDYRDCQPQWFHYAKTGLDFFASRLASLMGHDSPVRNTAYPDGQQEAKVRDGLAQFVPICTSRDLADYDYAVSINDDAIGFDVYFVPSERQQRNYFPGGGEPFEYYTGDGCSAKNVQRFSGTCSGVGRDGGMLVVVPDELSRPVTKISISLTEAA